MKLQINLNYKLVFEKNPKTIVKQNFFLILLSNTQIWKEQKTQICEFVDKKNVD